MSLEKYVFVLTYVNIPFVRFMNGRDPEGSMCNDVWTVTY
jgi:hypothetical protein